MANYRLSKYVYESKIIDSNDSLRGKQFMFSTRSAISILIAPELLHALKNGCFQSLSKKMYDKLIEYKFLISDTANEFLEIIDENNSEINKIDCLSITTQPTSNCQFACYYCGQEHSPNIMSEDVEYKYIERIRNIINNYPNKYKSIHNTWYGGEPLLAVDRIKHITNQLKQICREYSLDYSANMVTNGYLLTKEIFLELFTNYNISEYQITIDGTAVSHDSRRILAINNGATFKTIYNNILSIVKLSEYIEKNAQITIRINIDKSNYEEVDRFIDMLISDGVADKVVLTFAPIENWGGNDAGKASFLKNDFAKLELEWIKKCIDNHIKTTQVLPSRHYYSCMVELPHNEVFDAHGHTYACWEFPYTAYKGEKNMISSVDNVNFENKNATLKDFRTRIQKNEYPCSSCIMYPLCSGGCARSWHEGTPACPPYKYNLTDRLIYDYIYRKHVKTS